ncbi:hypothetical protein [Szabonella alba]|uniref:Uncharacterized protein n=1 Tax=Szabonella alba TaxID=2804194 RepID=A0A8K0V6E3_9RHOB|nr:hypothetical protein [Szabonella alba]MBL4916584.1 hypothetical protein [Szabonella alba]
MPLKGDAFRPAPDADANAATLLKADGYVIGKEAGLFGTPHIAGDRRAQQGCGLGG